MTIRSLILALLIVLLGSSAAGAQTGLRVLATTSIVADVAQNIAGDQFTIDSLVPLGADTHAFEPAPADVARVAGADILLTVGAGYEAFLGDLLRNVASDSVQVVVVSEGLEILGTADDHSHEGDHQDATAPMATEEAEADHAHAGEDAHLGVLGADLECEPHDDHDHGKRASKHGDEAHTHGDCDPHVWLDPASVIVWANNIADAFSAADPANAAVYRANADAYIAQLEALQVEIAEQVARVPEAARILVTNHEFLGYFAHAYGFEVVGTVLPGATTGAEPDPQTLAALVELIRSEGVRAIFAEVSANPRLAGIVAEEAGIAVVTTLYTESLSAAGEPASTYIDYMRYNVGQIVDALTADG
jgi:ABC-type Zn uptake system ZnuABC Zn-binding protein ZnuA